MWVTLQNNTDWDFFQDSDFGRDLEDAKSTSGGTLCVFGRFTFVPISWMCKKQISVSHSSTESEIISWDAGLRLDGIPALDLLDLIVAVSGNTIQTHDRRGQLVVNCGKDHGSNKRFQGMINVLNNIDCVLSNVQFSHQVLLELKTTKQWSRWFQKVGPATFFQDPRGCVWFDCSIEQI